MYRNSYACLNAQFSTYNRKFYIIVFTPIRSNVFLDSWIGKVGLSLSLYLFSVYLLYLPLPVFSRGIVVR